MAQEQRDAARADRESETPEPLRRLQRRFADLDLQLPGRDDDEVRADKERAKAARDADKERAKAARDADKERAKAARDADKERARAERDAAQRAQAEEAYAREEEKAIAREEARRARRERTVKRQPERVTFGATLRQSLWKILMVPLGGVRVKGTFPEGPVIIVPNHSSHVDTAAALGGIPTVMRPIPVAAADYWFRKPGRAWIARRAIGAFPVERGGRGAYHNLRELLRPRVEEACSILIFAEGTRSPDGRVQAFKKGPALLARDFDIPMLPLAIVGAHDAWPKGGKPRYSPVELRVGTPVEPDDDVEVAIDQAREQIIEMLDRGPAEEPVSVLWNAVHDFLGKPASSLLFVLAGLTNTLVWPLPAEASLALFGVARRDRIWINVACVAAGSVAGVAGAVLLAQSGRRSPRWLTTRGSRAQVHRLVARGGVAQVFWRTIEGAPDLAVAEAAAANHLPTDRVLAAVGAGSLVRSAVVVGVTAATKKPVGRYVRQQYATYLGLVGTGVAGWIGYRAIRWWGRRR